MRGRRSCLGFGWTELPELAARRGGAVTGGAAARLTRFGDGISFCGAICGRSVNMNCFLASARLGEVKAVCGDFSSACGNFEGSLIA